MATDRRVKQAYLWSSIFNTPFWALYGMLLFILYKDLHASALEISLLIALKPGVSLLSAYWSAHVHQRPDRLRANVMVASLLAHLPFFFVPFFAPTWFLVAAGASYMMLMRGIVPAWMELLKLHVPDRSRGRLFSLSSAISYVGSILLPLFFGHWLDLDSSVWKQLFPLAALISLLSLFFQWRIPVLQLPPKIEPPKSLRETLLHPWKTSLSLLHKRPDFWRFQIGFMLGGGGLMLLQPALPAFFVDRLQLSYTELALALSICKGIGYASTSRLWTTVMARLSFFRTSGLVTLFAALFPLALLLAPSFGLGWVYVAYLIYGVMQAGSELSWHLSGPHFAREEDSSSYSGVNVMAVGLRGVITPFLGSLLCAQLGAAPVLVVASLLCLGASLQLQRASLRTAPFP